MSLMIANYWIKYQILEANSAVIHYAYISWSINLKVQEFAPFSLFSSFSSNLIWHIFTDALLFRGFMWNNLNLIEIPICNHIICPYLFHNMSCAFRVKYFILSFAEVNLFQNNMWKLDPGYIVSFSEKS